MKRVLSIFFIIIIAITLSGCQKSVNNEVNQKNIYGVFKEGKASTLKVHLLLYFPDKNHKYLVPEERLAQIDKYIESTIAEEIMKGANTGLAPWPLKGVKVLSVSGKGNILTLNLSSNFIKAISANIYRDILVYSIVNSLTELPGVKGVLFQSEGSSIGKIGDIDFSKPLKRDRSYFNRDKAMKPNEVLRREMNFEKNGKWLNAYVMMSDDENNPNRKYYEAYIQEMQEMKDKGFLDTDFNVGNYTIDPSGKKASVEVSFGSNNVDKNNSNVNKTHFNTVKVDGAWMVDWLTKQ